MLHALFLLHSLLADPNALVAIARGLAKLSVGSWFVFCGLALRWVALGWNRRLGEGRGGHRSHSRGLPVSE